MVSVDSKSDIFVKNLFKKYNIPIDTKLEFKLSNDYFIRRLLTLNHDVATKIINISIGDILGEDIKKENLNNTFNEFKENYNSRKKVLDLVFDTSKYVIDIEVNYDNNLRTRKRNLAYLFGISINDYRNNDKTLPLLKKKIIQIVLVYSDKRVAAEKEIRFFDIKSNKIYADNVITKILGLVKLKKGEYNDDKMNEKKNLAIFLTDDKLYEIANASYILFGEENTKKDSDRYYEI